MTDSELIDRCAKGDEAAFLALYEQYSGCLYRFAYRLLGCQQRAEDAMQECFASLISNCRRFDAGRSSLRTYLFATIRNLALKQFRQSGNEVDFDCVPDLPDNSESMDPLVQLLVHERSAAVRDAITALSPILREVLILFEYEDLTISEIAGVVGSNPGTVKVRLHRARQAVRKLLSPMMTCQIPEFQRGTLK